MRGGGSGIAVVAGAVALALSAVAAAPAIAGEPASERAARTTLPLPDVTSRAEIRLERSLEKLVELPDGPPGASALLRRGDREILIRVGAANLKPAAPMRPNSHMRVASVSKAFNGAVALRLVDRGLLGLDEPAGARVPELPAEWHPVTLRQLLGHTSGLPNFTADPGWQQQFGTNPQAEPTPLEMIGFMSTTALEFEPGTEYRYSNTDNLVAGLMAERATGVPYDELLAAEVLEPLDLTRTALAADSVLPRPAIHGYELQPLGELTECCAMAWVWAAGAVYSTPRELTRFVRAYVSGELFGGEARRAQFEFVDGESEPPGPGRIGAGLALFRYETPCGTVFGHTGNFPGYTQFTASRRSGRRSLTVSANEQLSAVERPETFAKLKRSYRRAVCALLDSRSSK